jgi:hypothetical protein
MPDIGVTVVLALAIAATAAAAPTVFVSPGTALVAPGESFTMDIRVDGGTDTVTCFLVEFAFDPAIIQLTAADEGSLFAACGFPTMCNWDVLGPGHHSCNDVVLGPYAYAVAPGELVSLEFVAGQVVGSTPVEILAVDLRDYRRDRILPVWTTDAMVFVAPATGVGESEGPETSLAVTARPNPFGGSTEIEILWPDTTPGRDMAENRAGCSLPRSAPLAAVYDAGGRLVARLTPRQAARGWTACWDGRGRAGLRCAAGVYFATFEWQGFSVTKPVVLIH